MKYLVYDGFIGTVEFSEEDNIFYGVVLGVSDSISYQGINEDELSDDFVNAIKDYIDLCKKNGNEIKKICHVIGA